MSRNLDRPIIIIGAARSGTTLIGHLLAQHPLVAFWDEPNHIWRHRHAYRQSAVLTAADATPAVKRYIRTQFARYVERHEKQRFAEKTPHNCFRIPFIARVFPDARFVHLLRDGRAVAVSARLQWQRGLLVRRDVDAQGLVLNSSHGPEGPRSFVERLANAWYTSTKFVKDTRRFEGGPWAWLEAPASVPGALRTVARKHFPERSFLWGPRFPGMREVYRRFSLLETCALQWVFSVMAARSGLALLDPMQVLELRYEQLVADPVNTIDRIQDFLEMPKCEQLSEAARRSIQPTSENQWARTLSESERRQLEAWLEPILREIGYGITEHSIPTAGRA